MKKNAPDHLMRTLCPLPPCLYKLTVTIHRRPFTSSYLNVYPATPKCSFDHDPGRRTPASARRSACHSFFPRCARAQRASSHAGSKTFRNSAKSMRKKETEIMLVPNFRVDVADSGCRIRAWSPLTRNATKSV